jgi:hypothetical protein
MTIQIFDIERLAPFHQAEQRLNQFPKAFVEMHDESQLVRSLKKS